MKMEGLNELKHLKENRESFYIYFSAPNCGVCEALQPKIQELFQKEFPKLKVYQVDTGKQPEIAAQEGLFTNPSLLVFMDGQEVLRRSRTIGIDEISESLGRYYEMIF